MSTEHKAPYTQTIYPLHNLERHSPISNDMIDYIMPKLNPTAWRMLCLIARKTSGWNKRWDAISFSQFRKLANIGSNTTVQKGLNTLDEGGYILRRSQPGRQNADCYALNIDLCLEVERTYHPDNFPADRPGVASQEEPEDTRDIQRRWRRASKKMHRFKREELPERELSFSVLQSILESSTNYLVMELQKQSNVTLEEVEAYVRQEFWIEPDEPLLHDIRQRALDGFLAYRSERQKREKEAEEALMKTDEPH